jgi:hypothetical protein
LRPNPRDFSGGGGVTTGRRGFLALLNRVHSSLVAGEEQIYRPIHDLAALSSGRFESTEPTSSPPITGERAIALGRTPFVLNGS